MPFKSKAQARWCRAAAKRGEVPESMCEEFAGKTKSMKKLPEKVKKKSRRKRRG